MGKKIKDIVETPTFSKVKGDTLSTENHMQVMHRLGLGGGLVFAHGKPAPRVKKSH